MQKAEYQDRSGKWRVISVSEAEKLFRHTVSRDSGYFRCLACGLPVAFANPTWKERYFTHGRDSGADDSKCELFIQSFGGNALPAEGRYNKDYSFSINHGILPLRLNLENAYRFSLELGITPLPQEEYARLSSSTRLTIGKQSSSAVLTLNLADRLAQYGASFFPVPIADRYHVTCNQLKL